MKQLLSLLQSARVKVSSISIGKRNGRIDNGNVVMLHQQRMRRDKAPARVEKGLASLTHLARPSMLS